MEPFSLNLNEMTDKGGRYKRLLIILATIYLVTSAIAFWLLYINNSLNIWLFVGLTFYFLFFIYFGFVGYNAKMYINNDDFAFEYQFGFFTKVPEKIIWETITKVKLSFTHITFYKRSGKRKIVEIGWLPYIKVKEIKNKVHCFCTEKGLPVEIAEYHKEELKIEEIQNT
jgi:Ca2+/Na+ antiporter